MKSIVKLLVVSAFLTLLFAMPVMANTAASISAENTDVFLQKLQANASKEYNAFVELAKVQQGPGAEAAVANLAATATKDVAAVNKLCSINHIEYLTAKADLENKVCATRKVQLDYFTALSAGTNAYARELAQAQADYAAASVRLATANANLAYAQAALAPLM